MLFLRLTNFEHANTPSEDNPLVYHHLVNGWNSTVLSNLHTHHWIYTFVYKQDVPKKVRNEFSSLNLSKIAKVIRTTHNRGFNVNGGRSAPRQGGVPSLKIQKVPFFWDAQYVFNGFLMTKNVFDPQYLLTLQINILIFCKQDIKCKGWREHARVGTRT